uniref:Coiled-coil domain-containing protein 181 n=1 Tax=Sphaeramia orbicularis TaxID=375764 RepID=A0A672YZI2_9TELE
MKAFLLFHLQGPNYEDIEAEIDKELAQDEKQKDKKKERRGSKSDEQKEDEERWPSPMEPLEYDSDRDSPNSKASPIIPPPPGTDQQTDEEKKYILEKIQRANRELLDQEAPDTTRRRRLHFKETLVDLVVPPLQFEKDADKTKKAQVEREVSGKLSELKLSPHEDSVQLSGGGFSDGGPEGKEGRVLVEKDGKFDLVSLKEVESQGLLPPISNSHDSAACTQDHTGSSSKIHHSSSSPCHSATFSPASQRSGGKVSAPRPPSLPRPRPSSASHSLRGNHSRNAKRRVQSATETPSQATYTLTPQQKELLQKIQERKEKMAREAEQRKHEEEEQKRQENELAFKAWLLRKRDQLQEERRIHRAQEMERMSSKVCDPGGAFKLWLQRKQEQQQKEKQLVELKRLEEDSGYLLHSPEECERAFKLWLKRKRAEKRAEQQAAREHSRRLVLEERRARRIRDLMCTVNEAKVFRFNEQLAYRY